MYFGILALGGVLVWSGVKGKSVSGTLRQLAGGDDPNASPPVNQIATVNPTPTAGGSAGPPVTGNAGQTAVATAILSAVAAPPTPANLASMTDWFNHEFPNTWPPTAKYNPMATTQPMPGSTRFNSVGVQNYTSWSQGIAANVQTLENGDYEAILSALRQGIGLATGNTQVEAELMTWSGGGYNSV